MSIEELRTVYLRCDAPAYWSPDDRCPVRFDDGGGLGDSDDQIDLLLRRAGADGWEFKVENQGLKGITVACRCPDHREDPQLAVTSPDG